MTLTMLDKVLWAAGFLAHAALLLVLLLRRRAREFPVFTSLIAYELLTTAVLFVASRHGSRRAYFLAYWITGFGDYVFQVALIYEIARNILRPTGTWVRDARKAFLLWGALGLLIAVGISLRMGPPEARGFNLWDARITVFTCLLTTELFLAMSVAANRLGLQRRSHVVALGQGLMLWDGTALLGDLGHVVYGWSREFVLFDRIQMFAYLGALVYWIVAFYLPERQRAPLSPEMRDYLVALHRRVEYDLDRISR
jgi:hypothetical protein